MKTYGKNPAETVKQKPKLYNEMKFFQTAATLASATALFARVSGECDGIRKADIVTELDLYNSVVATNTLHLPDGELRYTSKFAMQRCLFASVGLSRAIVPCVP